MREINSWPALSVHLTCLKAVTCNSNVLKCRVLLIVLRLSIILHLYMELLQLHSSRQIFEMTVL